MSNGKGSVRLEPLLEQDLLEVAEFYKACFSGDGIATLLHPPHLRDPNLTNEQRIAITAHSLKKAHLDNKDKICLKAVQETKDDDDGQGRKIVGAAIWVKPGVPISEPKEAADKINTNESGIQGRSGESENADHLKDTEFDLEAYKDFIEILVSGREEAMGGQEHWYLAFIFVAPAAQGLGISSKLLEWGFNKADSNDPPLPIFLESSVNAEPVYAKKGFKVVGYNHIALANNDKNGEKDGSVVYKMPRMVREPGSEGR